MTSRQIELIEATFDMVRANAEHTGRMFYDRMFQMDPSIRPLFRGVVRYQSRKLMEVLGMAISSLRREQGLPDLEDLGRKQAACGVKDEHYVLGGSALLWTLEDALGAIFTTEVCSAWTELYWGAVATMRRGAAAAMRDEPAFAPMLMEYSMA